jgi:hypothetical protein
VGSRATTCYVVLARRGLGTWIVLHRVRSSKADVIVVVIHQASAFVSVVSLAGAPSAAFALASDAMVDAGIGSGALPGSSDFFSSGFSSAAGAGSTAPSAEEPLVVCASSNAVLNWPASVMSR